MEYGQPDENIVNLCRGKYCACETRENRSSVFGLAVLVWGILTLVLCFHRYSKTHHPYYLTYVGCYILIWGLISTLHSEDEELVSHVNFRTIQAGTYAIHFGVIGWYIVTIFQNVDTIYYQIVFGFLHLINWFLMIVYFRLDPVHVERSPLLSSTKDEN